MARWSGGGRITAFLALVPAVVLSAAGCADQGRVAAPARPHPSTVERLAAAAGCAPAIQEHITGLREGTCLTARGSYVMATFPTATAMRTWLARSQAYGGAYLVGERWVVAGQPAALRPVQQRLGGAILSGSRRG